MVNSILFINSWPNDKFLDRTKLRAFADDKLSIAVMMISLLYKAENAMGKGENVGYQHFLLFSVFQSLLA